MIVRVYLSPKHLPYSIYHISYPCSTTTSIISRMKERGEKQQLRIKTKKKKKLIKKNYVIINKNQSSTTNFINVAPHYLFIRRSRLLIHK